MYRKHFRAIAKALAIPSPLAWNISEEIGSILAKINPRFSWVKWQDAFLENLPPFYNQDISFAIEYEDENLINTILERFKDGVFAVERALGSKTIYATANVEPFTAIAEITKRLRDIKTRILVLHRWTIYTGQWP